jgi:Mannosylglycerate hydrolase MGH1-like glycoside hydrolase domain
VLTDGDTAKIRQTCEATLRQNWREGVRDTDRVPFAYTCPSPGHYPWQWYWDSCFAAIVWRHFDPTRSQRELGSLLAAQREDGFIGHTIFWNTPLTGRRRFTYNVTSPNAQMTSSIQPPLLAWAWRIAVGDPAAVPGIVRHYEWLSANRDLDGDGLVWIVQPDESGLDASPQFDAVWGRHAHDRPGFIFLVRRNRKLGYDLRRINAAGGPVCAEVATNVLLGLSLLALGRPSLTPTIVERMYNDSAGLFEPIVRPKPKQNPARTWAALAPLALPDLPEPIGRRLIEDHLLDDREFWLPVPPPSVPPTEPSFSLRNDHHLWIRRYWRGPTWINAAWLVWLGLTRLGYHPQSQTLATRIMSAVLAEGLREYYDPYTGGGMGQVDFAWSSLVMEMFAADPLTAAGSYLSLPAGTD